MASDRSLHFEVLGLEVTRCREYVPHIVEMKSDILKRPQIWRSSICPLSVLNSLSSRLLVSTLFSGVFFLEFCPVFSWAVFLHLLIWAVSLCLFLCIR